MTRLPEALCRRLEREAAREGRSMNAEIIHRLQQSFQAPDQGIDIVEIDERLKKVEREIYEYAVPRKMGDKS
jgi:hypothetical protein